MSRNINIVAVTAEVWPKGSMDAAKPLGRMVIIPVAFRGGDQPGASCVDFEVSAYDAKRQQPLVPPWEWERYKSGTVKDFDKARGYWSLLNDSLKAAGVVRRR
jgi:hypothetical protein